MCPRLKRVFGDTWRPRLRCLGAGLRVMCFTPARFAFEYGFHQLFVEDAMSALSAEEHTTTVTKIFPRIGLVRKTKEILADLAPD